MLNTECEVQSQLGTPNSALERGRARHAGQYPMKAFRRIVVRFGSVVVPLTLLLIIVGFHELPALWVPLVVIFVIAWIMGARGDRKARAARKRRPMRA